MAMYGPECILRLRIFAFVKLMQLLHKFCAYSWEILPTGVPFVTIRGVVLCFQSAVSVYILPNTFRGSKIGQGALERGLSPGN